MSRKNKRAKSELLIAAAAIGTLGLLAIVPRIADAISRASLVDFASVAGIICAGAALHFGVYRFASWVLTEPTQMPYRAPPKKPRLQDDARYLAHLRRTSEATKYKIGSREKPKVKIDQSPLFVSDDDISHVGTGRPAPSLDIPF